MALSFYQIRRPAEVVVTEAQVEQLKNNLEEIKTQIKGLTTNSQETKEQVEQVKGVLQDTGEHTEQIKKLLGEIKTQIKEQNKRNTLPIESTTPSN